MLSVLTPAKINLFLNVRQPRGDGFHEICSVMQTVQLWDRLDVTPTLTGKPDIAFTCNDPQLEMEAESNLVVRAYNLFWQATGLPKLGLNVHLEKQIPMQAGLGGGSSDAAAMLMVLDHLSLARLSISQLRLMGATLGSDVPFFITGGTALVKGRGETIQPLSHEANISRNVFPVVIIKPKRLSVSTADAYGLIRKRARYEERSPDHLLMTLGKRRVTSDELESYLWNDFEKPLFEAYPLFREMAGKMRSAGIRRPLLCGSGSAMAGFMAFTHQHRKAIQDLFPTSEFEIFWTQTYPDGIQQTRMQSVPTP